MTLRPLRGVLVSLTVLAACGPVEPGVEGGSDAGSSTDDPSASASDTGPGSTTGSDSETGPMVGSTSGEPTCMGLEPEDSGIVTLTVHNDGDAPVFLDVLSCNPVASVSRSDGTPMLWQPPGCDAPTCEALLAGDCSVACGDCIGGFVRLGPGQSTEITWEGTIYEPTQTDAECTPQGCHPGCYRELAADLGSYLAQTAFVTECPYTDTAICDCPDGQDVCSIYSFDEFPEVETTARAVEFEFAGSDLAVDLYLP